MSNAIIKLKNKLIDCGLATEETIIGCSEDEITLLQENENIKRFPKMYHEFLRLMGEETGKFMPYTNQKLYQLFDERYWTNHELRLLNIKFQLSEYDFVFMYIPEGYAFWYFNTKDQNDDPPVYEYREDDEESKLISERLTDFLHKLADEECTPPQIPWKS